MRVTKRRLLLGIAGCLITLVMAAPVSAGGQGHGTVDVNDVTKDPHGGLVKGSDGGERNINAYLPMQTVRNLAFSPAGPQNSGGGTVDTQAAFLYE